MNSSTAIYQFGSLEFHPSQQLLSGGAERAALPATLNKLLLLFVSRPGQLITRDDIANALWNDHGTVDIENGINGAVRRLRQQLVAVSPADVLGTPSANTYIDTVVGTGYRFTSPVTVIVPGSAEERENAVAPGGYAQVPGSNYWLRNILLVCLACVALAWGYEHSRRKAAVARETTTSFAIEPFPVTYKELEENITAQAISPSGRFVAVSDRDGLALQPLHSQDSTRVLSVRQQAPQGLRIDHLSWFADEQHLLVSGMRAGVNPSELTSEAWLVEASAQPTLPGQPTQLGQAQMPTLLLTDAALAVVSPDGRRVAYLRAGLSEVWVADADGQNTRRLIAATAGNRFTTVLWSPGSDRVVVDRVTTDSRGATDANQAALKQLREHQHFAYESYAAATGKLLARVADMSFDSGLLLPDGRFIYPVDVVGESVKLAAARTDTATGKILSSFKASNLLDIGLGVTSVRSLTATRKGDLLSAVFERPSADVNIGTLHAPPSGSLAPPTLSNVSRLTHHTGSSYPTSWSPDGNVLLFDSGDGGRWVVAQQATGTANLTVLADTGGRAVQGQFTPDGRWVLFLHYAGEPTHVQSIDSVPSSGGASHPLYSSIDIEDFHCSRSARGICVVRESIGNEALVYHLLDPLTGRGPELARTAWETNVLGDWSLSADGKTIAMASHDSVHPGFSIIPLADPLTAKQGHTNALYDAHKIQARKILVTGFGNVLCPSWNVEGTGFFVETHAETGYTLVYVDLKGNATSFLKSPDPIWGVQSRDGKRIAYPAQTPSNRNVWAATIQ